MSKALEKRRRRWLAREAAIADKEPRERKPTVSIIDRAPLWNGRPCWLVSAAGYAGVPDDAPCPYCTAAKATHYAVPGDGGNVTLVCPAAEDVERLKNVMIAAKRSAPSERDIERLIKTKQGVTAENLLLTTLKEKALREVGQPIVVPTVKPSEYDVAEWMEASDAALVRVALAVDLLLLGGGVFSAVGSSEIARMRVTDLIAAENIRLRGVGSLRLVDREAFRFRQEAGFSLTQRVRAGVLDICRLLANAADVELQKAAITQKLTPVLLGQQVNALNLLRANVSRVAVAVAAGRRGGKTVTPEYEIAEYVSGAIAGGSAEDSYFDLSKIPASATSSVSVGSTTRKPAAAPPVVVQPKKRGFDFDE